MQKSSLWFWHLDIRRRINTWVTWNSSNIRRRIRKCERKYTLNVDALSFFIMITLGLHLFFSILLLLFKKINQVWRQRRVDKFPINIEFILSIFIPINFKKLITNCINHHGILPVWKRSSKTRWNWGLTYNPQIPDIYYQGWLLFREAKKLPHSRTLIPFGMFLTILKLVVQHKSRTSPDVCLRRSGWSE